MSFYAFLVWPLNSQFIWAGPPCKISVRMLCVQIYYINIVTFIALSVFIGFLVLRKADINKIDC